VLASRSLSDGQQILQCRATYHVCSCPGKDTGASCNRPDICRAGNNCSGTTLSTNSFSGWEPPLEFCYPPVLSPAEQLILNGLSTYQILVMGTIMLDHKFWVCSSMSETFCPSMIVPLTTTNSLSGRKRILDWRRAT